MTKSINFIATVNNSPVKITFDSIAKAIGVSNNTITAWHNGKPMTKPNEKKLIELFKKHNIPLVFKSK